MSSSKTDDSTKRPTNNFAKKVVETTSQVFKFLELSVEELSKLSPKNMEDAMDDFDKEIQSLKDRLVELDEEKEDIKDQLKEHRKRKKELIQKLKQKKI